MTRKIYQKVNKRKAQKLFAEGKKIYLVPCKVHPYANNNWMVNIDNSRTDDFNLLVMLFAWHNCCNELGRYPSYYI